MRLRKLLAPLAMLGTMPGMALAGPAAAQTERAPAPPVTISAPAILPAPPAPPAPPPPAPITPAAPDPAWAEADYQRGHEELKAGNVDTALLAFARSCDAGNPKSCFNKGLLWEQQNKKGALPKIEERWIADAFRASCNGGFQRGCAIYAGFLKDGAGVEKNEALAAELIATACEQKEGIACLRLATAAYHGTGETQDRSKAAGFYKRACDNGEPTSCFDYAMMRFTGEAIPADKSEGIAYYRKGCDQNFTPACMNLAMVYAKGDGLPRDMDKAKELLHRPCPVEHRSACVSAALTYAAVHDLPRDRAAAAKLYRRDCDQNDAQRCFELAHLMAKTDEGSAEHRSSFALFAKACTLGNGAACYNAGLGRWLGMRGAQPEQQEAYAWFTQGCAQKDANSCAAAAMMRVAIRGDQVAPADLAEAERWLAQARLIEANGLLVRSMEGWMEMTRERLAEKWAANAR